MERILKILEKDARTTPEKIATMTGMPEAKIKKIIKQAEKDKTIVKYKTIIDWSRLEEESVRAIIEVKTIPRKDIGFDAVAKRIASFPQVISAYLVSGTYDLTILVAGKSNQEISNFVSAKLATLELVQATVTHFLLKRYKEDGEILQDKKDNKRLPLTS